MLRKEEEIIDVSLAVLAAAGGKKRVGILQVFGAELIDRDRTAFLQEKPAVASVFKEFEDRSGRLHAMPVLRFHEEHGLAVFEHFDRTVQDIQFVALNADLHEGNAL